MKDWFFIGLEGNFTPPKRRRCTEQYTKEEEESASQEFIHTNGLDAISTPELDTTSSSQPTAVPELPPRLRNLFSD